MLKCDLCGTPLKNSQAIFTPKENDNYIITCPLHSQLFKTCQLCLENRECDFERNPSKTPKVVQKQIKQGPMTQIVQIKNPDRIAETCAVNCKCYDAEIGCLREHNTCEKYNEVPL